MAAKVSMHTLQAGVVLSRSSFVNETSDQMAETITAITKLGRPLLVVDDAAKFFTMGTLIEMAKANDPRLPIIAEYFEQQGLIAPGNNQPPAAGIEHEEDGVVVRKVNADHGAGYQFAATPAGWSVGTDISLGPTKIKRKRKNSTGEGTQVYISTDSFSRMAIAALKYWAKVPGWAGSVSVSTHDGQRRTAYFNSDRITIDGIAWRRYEVEQIAKYRGWEFPVKIAA